MKTLFKIRRLFVLNYTCNKSILTRPNSVDRDIATAKTTVSRQSTTPQQNDDFSPFPEFTFYVN